MYSILELLLYNTMQNFVFRANFIEMLTLLVERKANDNTDTIGGKKSQLVEENGMFNILTTINIFMVCRVYHQSC